MDNNSLIDSFVEADPDYVLQKEFNCPADPWDDFLEFRPEPDNVVFDYLDEEPIMSTPYYLHVLLTYIH